MSADQIVRHDNMGEDEAGVVVCDIGSGIYTLQDPEAQWGHLKKGVMIDFPRYGLIHYEDQLDEDIHLVARGQN